MEKNEVVRDPAQGELPFRAYMETGSLPAFRDTAATVTVQPIQRKKEGYMPMERKPASVYECRFGVFAGQGLEGRKQNDKIKS